MSNGQEVKRRSWINNKYSRISILFFKVLVSEFELVKRLQQCWVASVAEWPRSRIRGQHCFYRVVYSNPGAAKTRYVEVSINSGEDQGLQDAIVGQFEEWSTCSSDVLFISSWLFKYDD
ncbi:hypothetical protein TNCV_3880741 [Trichonephila clavipes]|nr:hypothetical protein TNCV_3880741 [Trichonephila clavipes]